MIALDMDNFYSMRLVEKRGDRYVLLDGAPAGEVVLEVAEGHEDPVSDIPAPPIYPADVLACIEVAQ